MPRETAQVGFERKAAIPLPAVRGLQVASSTTFILESSYRNPALTATSEASKTQH